MPILRHAFAFVLLLALAVAARADCIADAAIRHRVNGDVLRAIGWQESGLRAAALGRNANGTVDVGAFQINSIHLPELARHGIDAAALGNGCVSAEVAAWHYRRQVDQLGNTWAAVGAYHSRTRARAAWYANRIAAILMRWNVMPAGPLPFSERDTRAPDPPYRPLPPATSAPSPGPLVAPPGVAYEAIAFAPPAR